VEKYGFSYRVPSGWISGQGPPPTDNPVLQDVAQKMGVPVKQLITSMGTAIQAYSISDHGVVGGILDNVNTIGVPAGGLTDAQLTAQIAAVGARPGKAVHVQTPAGDVTRMSYVWHTNGLTIHGVARALDLGDSTASVTVTSHAVGSATSIADLVQGSLQKID
jgi:hypothetical protein